MDAKIKKEFVIDYETGQLLRMAANYFSWKEYKQFLKIVWDALERKEGKQGSS